MKTHFKYILGILLIVFGFTSISEAGCDSISAVKAVIGQKYSARNHQNYPQYLSFHADGTASFGSALGHPVGVFNFYGTCMNRIFVSFTPTEGPDTGITHDLFLLYPENKDNFDVFVDKYSGQKFYKE